MESALICDDAPAGLRLWGLHRCGKGLGTAPQLVEVQSPGQKPGTPIPSRSVVWGTRDTRGCRMVPAADLASGSAGTQRAEGLPGPHPG